MPRYKFTLTDQEKEELEKLVQKDGKGYRIKHAQILLKLNHIPENNTWTNKRIQTAYNATNSTISGVAKRFVTDGMEAAL
ncbi:MAG: IS630 family transposase, partial [Candidatus Bathyarchaeota archaeon]|nr:IS630 family transposase [Candidatus Termiticorpusculum sp.]